MSLVKKTLTKISKDKKDKEVKQKEKQKEKTNKIIEIHRIYKDLIKKNNIFKDLKELKKETEKTTPHIFFHLNDNSNNYLAKLKKIDFNSDVSNSLNSSSSEDREWLGCIIFADIYYKTGIKILGTDYTYISRIGFSIDSSHELLKPNFWFHMPYEHIEEATYTVINENPLPYSFKTYDKMMSNFIEKIMDVTNDKDKVFKKPVGGFLNLYKKSYDFTDSVNIKNFDKIHS